MAKIKVPVFGTIGQAFRCLKENILLVASSLAFPFALLFLTHHFLFMQHADVAHALLHKGTFPIQGLFLTALINLFAGILVAGICYRIALTGSPGNLLWGKPEMMMLLRVLQIYLLGMLFMIPGLSLALIIFVISKKLMFLSFIILFVNYLFVTIFALRFTVVITAAAIGDRVKIFKVYSALRGNTWRLVMLILLIAVPAIVLGVFSLSLKNELTSLLIYLLSESVIAVAWLSIGFFYKALRPEILGETAPQKGTAA